jgi:hypothetical protein
MSDGPGGTDVVTSADRAVEEPADRALGYGGRAANQGVRVAEAPAKKPPAPARKKPQHVLAAEAERNRLAPFAPNPAAAKKVGIYDLAKFRVKVIRDFATAGGFAAWTNSASEIFVVPGLEDPANYAALRAALYHEFLHVDQFAKAGGKPPSQYLDMVKYEVDAYKDSANWLRNPTDGGQPDQASAKEMDKAHAFFTQALGGKKLPDPQYGALLVANDYLPKHTGGIQSLYCRKRPCEVP